VLVLRKEIQMHSETQIPQELKVKVDRELQPGERITWMDMPIPTFFTPKSKAMFLFAIPWTLFTVFWICAAAGFKIADFSEGSDLFPLFGLPFLFIGISMLLSPVFSYYKSLKTVYVITNQRALTFEGGWAETVRSYPPPKLLNVYRNEKRNGTGDVIISFDEWRDSDGDRKTELLGFFRIRAPKTAEMMLQALAKQAGAATNAKPITTSGAKVQKGSFRSGETMINQGNLSQSKSSAFIGKLIVILVFSCFLGFSHYTDALQEYEKGQRLTLNAYIEKFDAHKAELLNPPDPLWADILVVSFMVAAFFGIYELLGKGVGWIIQRIFHAKKEETYLDGSQIV
jgi:hypothetical protein